MSQSPKVVMRIFRLLAPLALATACMEATGPQAGDGPRLVSLTSESLSGDAGFALPTPVRVQVIDAAGHGAPGETVAFTVLEGGGSVTPAAATTDAEGIAQAQWVLGP